MQCPGCKKYKRGDNCQACYLAESQLNNTVWIRLHEIETSVSGTRIREEIAKLRKEISKDQELR